MVANAVHIDWRGMKLIFKETTKPGDALCTVLGLLNVRLFQSAPQMQVAAQEWLVDYNEVRPHSSLGYLTPQEFVQTLQIEAAPQLAVA